MTSRPGKRLTRAPAGRVRSPPYGEPVDNTGGPDDTSPRRSGSVPSASAALIAAGASGLLLQSVQRVDPTFVLLYLTVWAVLLAMAAQMLLLARPGARSGAWLRDASCTAVLVSGLVYLTVLLPATGLVAEDGPVVWAANALLHVVCPALGVAVTLRAPRTRMPSRGEVASWLVLPLGYLLVLGALAATDVAVVPYDFLAPSQVGPLGVAASVLGALALFAAVGALVQQAIGATLRRAAAAVRPEA